MIHQVKRNAFGHAIAFHLIMAIVLCAFLFQVPGRAQSLGRMAVAPGYVHSFVGNMQIQPKGRENPIFAQPFPKYQQPAGAVSGTDFEFAAVPVWLSTVPGGKPYVDINGLDYFEIDLTGEDITGHAVVEVLASHNFVGEKLPHAAYWEIGARIDTTEFRTGVPIVITAWSIAHDSGWINVPVTWFFMPINNVLLFGNKNLVAATENPNPPNANMSYAEQKSVDGMANPLVTSYGYHGDIMKNVLVGPTLDTIKTLLPRDTALIVASHGNVGNFGSVDATPDSSVDTTVVLSPDVAMAVGKKDLWSPPYTFAYFQACDVFGNIPSYAPDKPGTFSEILPYQYSDQMTTALFEGVNIPVNDDSETLPHADSSDPDRAAVGFQYLVGLSLATAKFSTELITYLANHYDTVTNCIKAAYKISPCTVAVGGSDANPIWGTAQPVVQGDADMTLRGVYTHGTPQDASHRSGVYVGFVQDVDKAYTPPN